VARFRLRNEVGERKYWEEEEGKLCRMCGGGVESWEHISGRDAEAGGMEKEVGRRRILGENGEGEE